MERYPDDILDLLTVTGFDNQWWKATQKYNTWEEAYEALEKKVYFYFKVRRYSHYNSFRK